MIKLVGILNVTPDSFSDGGKYMARGAAFSCAEDMLEHGARLIDVGGDSTRPGSNCVSAPEEWRRIGALIPALSELVPVSVDTHSALTARLALQSGAVMINDVSAGSDPEMFPVVAQAGARIVLMHSRCPQPHVFPAADQSGDVISRAGEFLMRRVDMALGSGIRRENIVLDPGMGAFISVDPQVSFELLERFRELEALDCALMLGLSRKGFMKKPGESGPAARDAQSARLAVKVCKELSFKNPLYLRVHNVKLHVDELQRAGLLRTEEG